MLVTGATGPHGGAVAEALLAGGHPVRALTRDPSSGHGRDLALRGAELAAGDLLDEKSLLSAMTDVGAVYAVTTPFSAGPRGEVEQGHHILAAACEAGVPWLILASVASADRTTGIPHFDSKAQMADALSAASGRPVGYRQSDLGQIDARNRDIAEMYRYLEQTGYQVDIPTLRRRFPEATWTTFADWARQAVR